MVMSHALITGAACYQTIYGDKNVCITCLKCVCFSMKDEAAGEIPVAFVVRSNGSKISEDDIKQYISKQVPLLTFIY